MDWKSTCRKAVSLGLLTLLASQGCSGEGMGEREPGVGTGAPPSPLPPPPWNRAVDLGGKAVTYPRALP